MSGGHDAPFAGGVDLGLYGLERAIGRYSEARTTTYATGDGGKAAASVVGEALWWVHALDDFFAKTLGPPWYELRDSHPDGKCVAGLLYARNLHTHELAPLGCIADDHRPYPPEPPPASPPNLGANDRYVVLGTARVVLAWRELPNLPAPAKTESQGRDMLYAERVATRPLIEPIQDALHFFTAQRSLLP